MDTGVMIAVWRGVEGDGSARAHGCLSAGLDSSI